MYTQICAHPNNNFSKKNINLQIVLVLHRNDLIDLHFLGSQTKLEKRTMGSLWYPSFAIPKTQCTYWWVRILGLGLKSFTLILFNLFILLS